MTEELDVGEQDYDYDELFRDEEEEEVKDEKDDVEPPADEPAPEESKAKPAVVEKVEEQPLVDTEFMKIYNRHVGTLSSISGVKKEDVSTAAYQAAMSEYNQSKTINRQLEDIREEIFLTTEEGKAYQDMKKMAPGISKEAALQMYHALKQEQLSMERSKGSKKAKGGSLSDKEKWAADLFGLDAKKFKKGLELHKTREEKWPENEMLIGRIGI